jgi:hypothetical protein
LFNATGSGRVIKVYRVMVSGAPVAAVTGLVVALHGVRITTAPTGGTSAGAHGKSDNTDPDAPAQITAMVGATGGAAESGPPFGVGTVSGEETQGASFVPLYKADIDGTKPLTCREGEGILVKQGALASAGAVHVVIGFSVVTP